MECTDGLQYSRLHLHLSWTHKWPCMRNIRLDDDDRCVEIQKVTNQFGDRQSFIFGEIQPHHKHFSTCWFWLSRSLSVWHLSGWVLDEYFSTHHTPRQSFIFGEIRPRHKHFSTCWFRLSRLSLECLTLGWLSAWLMHSSQHTTPHLSPVQMRVSVCCTVWSEQKQRKNNGQSLSKTGYQLKTVQIRLATTFHSSTSLSDKLHYTTKSEIKKIWPIFKQG